MKKLSSLFTAISLALVCSALYAPSASPQAGRVIFKSFKNLLKAGSRNAPKVIRKSYRIIKTQETYDNALKIAQFTLENRNTIHQIYINCQQGLVSQDINVLPQDQQFSFVRDICGKF